MEKLTNKDRLKELEKIAKKLGIGHDREVECFGCKKTIKFKDVITLTNKKKVTYLCKSCYKKLESGDLNKSQTDKNEILKTILEDYKKHENIKITPWVPETDKWNPSYDEEMTSRTNGDFKEKYTGISIADSYLISSIKRDGLLKFENKINDKTNPTSSR